MVLETSYAASAGRWLTSFLNGPGVEDEDGRGLGRAEADGREWLTNG